MSTKKQKRERLQKAREETAKREFKYTTAQTLIGIFALALMFFAWGSHLLPVTDPVESNYALTAKEMVYSLCSDYSTPFSKEKSVFFTVKIPSL